MLIDICVNLTNRVFTDPGEVLGEANAAGVASVVICGTSVSGSQDAATLATNHGHYSTAGIHPHDAKDAKQEDIKALTEICALPSTVAVGECGLDFNRNYSPPDKQIEWFERQLSLAAQLEMPVLLHERDAQGELLHHLKKFRDRLPGAVLHCFTGGPDSLKHYLDLDLYIGVTGWLCDERRGQDLRDALPAIPDNRLLLETDAPYLLPRNLVPKPTSRNNQPKYLPHIAREVATLRKQDYETLAKQTASNTRQLFTKMKAKV